MIIDPYRKDKPYGLYFEKLVRHSYKQMKEKNDDMLMLIVGVTGGGKSNLGMHTYSILDDTPSVEQIALNPQDFSRALLNAGNMKGVRYLQYDEGKVNRQQWMTKWFQDILGIYHDVRGLNIFHVWCSAYPELLPKNFIQERVKCMIVVINKHEKLPREFLYFTKKDILRFMEQNDKLTVAILKKYGEKHATLKSWFHEYTGDLRKAYEEKKTDRMHKLVNEFFNKWNGGTIKQSDFANEMGVSRSTIRNVTNRYIEDKTFELNKHYGVNATGAIVLLPEGADYLRNYFEEKISHRLEVLSTKNQNAEIANDAPLIFINRVKGQTLPKPGRKESII